MKQWIGCLVILGLWSCSGVEEKKSVAPNKEVAFEIQGMTCAEGCAAFIQHRLNQNLGIASAEVNFTSGLCRVQFDSTLTEAQTIENEIEALNQSAYQATLTQLNPIQ